MKLLNKLICLVRGHIYYDCICGRCGKHMFDTPIKKFFKKRICLFRGHKWEKTVEWSVRHYMQKCARCGKTKEEVI